MRKPVPNLKTKALDLLARRDYAPLELATKLQKYSNDEAAIKAVIDELIRQRLLDEQRFIENFIQHKSSKYGSRKVKYLLSQKVTDSSVIDEIYRHSNIDELALACQQLTKKFATPPLEAKSQAKYLRFLLNRGFSFSIAQQALQEAFIHSVY